MTSRTSLAVCANVGLPLVGEELCFVVGFRALDFGTVVMGAAVVLHGTVVIGVAVVLHGTVVIGVAVVLPGSRASPPSSMVSPEEGSVICCGAEAIRTSRVPLAASVAVEARTTIASWTSWIR